MTCGATRFLVLWVVLALLPACSTRPTAVGTNEVGANEVWSPSGATLADGFFKEVTTSRNATPLAAIRREPALDRRAEDGARMLAAGLPDDIDVGRHLDQEAPLPEGLEYGVGFEDETPGLDERTRRAGERRGGSTISDALLAGDPGLDAIGWAGSGPWAVVVLQYRPFTPADGSPLQAALESALQRKRPKLRPDPALTAVATEAVADGLIDDDDEVRFATAGGMPVRIVHRQRGPHRSTGTVNRALTHDGPGTLQEPRLDRVGIAAKVTDRGNVLYVVLATGEADRSALEAELRAAEPKAQKLMDDARSSKGLPPLRLDPALSQAARQSLGQAIRLGCFPLDPGCPAAEPRRADQWYDRQLTWFSAEDAFTWNLSSEDDPAGELKRFGVAAAAGPHGGVWSMLLLAA